MKIFIIFLCFASAISEQNFVNRATSKITAELLNALKVETNENSIFAPFSLTIGFGMAYEGLAGRSRETVGRGLGFPSDDQEFRDGFRASIPANTETETTSYANLVTVEDAAGIKNDFALSMTGVFKANPFRHPFNERPVLAQRSINKWVANRSNGKIKDLLPRGTVTKATKVVLVNVIHFKDDWEKLFDGVINGEFNLERNAGKISDVPMMFGDLEVGYKNKRNFEIVSLPFKDQVHEMVFVLPADGRTVNDVIDEINADQDILSEDIANPKQFERLLASLTIPKFKVEKRLKLQEVLGVDNPDLGPIFSDRNDFSRMAKNSEGFQIEGIHHKAVIDVDEKGVEASGATGIAISVKAFFVPEVEVKMNKPFLYFIIDKERNNILFAGKLMNPSL